MLEKMFKISSNPMKTPKSLFYMKNYNNQIQVIKDNVNYRLLSNYVLKTQSQVLNIHFMHKIFNNIIKTHYNSNLKVVLGNNYY